MVDLFQFQFAERVRIIDIDGDEFVGKVIDIADREDTIDGEYDEITISVDGTYIGFTSAEISSIEEVEA